MTALQMTAVSKGSLGTFPLFVLLGALSKADLGVGCRIERNVLPSCFEYVHRPPFTILAYFVRRVKGH
jgi:hypothetical protein